MKKQLYIYVVLIFMFVCYNLFFKLNDEREHTIVNILFSSVLFLYLTYIAVVILKKIKQ